MKITVEIPDEEAMQYIGWMRAIAKELPDSLSCVPVSLSDILYSAIYNQVPAERLEFICKRDKI